MADMSLLSALLSLCRRIKAAPTNSRAPPTDIATIARGRKPPSPLSDDLLLDGAEIVSSFGSPSMGAVGGTSGSFSTGAAAIVKIGSDRVR